MKLSTKIYTLLSLCILFSLQLRAGDDENKNSISLMEWKQAWSKEGIAPVSTWKMSAKDTEEDLLEAIKEGHRIDEETLKAYYDVQISTVIDGYMPMHGIDTWAAIFGNLFVLQDLLALKLLDIHFVGQKNILRRVTLHFAAQYGQINVVLFLLEMGVKIDIRDRHGLAPLHWAAQGHSPYAVQFLIEKGTFIDLQDNDGRTALHWAIHSLIPLAKTLTFEDLRIVRLLLKQGAKINLADDEGQTPLHLAADSFGIPFVRFLLEQQAQIDAQNKSGSTPLHLSTKAGNIDVVKFLIEKGANLHTQDQNKQTALHLAARHGRLAVLRLLIDKGAQVDAQDKEGQTPLDLAVRYGHLQIAEILEAALEPRVSFLDNHLTMSELEEETVEEANGGEHAHCMNAYLFQDSRNSTHLGNQDRWQSTF